MTINLIKPNRYQDSVTLMQVAVKLRAILERFLVAEAGTRG